MAKSKHITLSRRAALLGGVSVAALAGTAGVAVAAAAHEHPDAEILRLRDRLDAMMPELAHLRDEQKRLWEIWQAHPETQRLKLEREAALRYWHRNDDKTWLCEVDAKNERLQQEIGFAQAADATSKAWRAFDAVYEAMFALPANTPVGVLAKLRYARRNLGDDPVFEYFTIPNSYWLDSAIADLERIGASS